MSDPTRFDQAWADGVREQCDPVFARADVGFTFNATGIDPGTGSVQSLLWEAVPERFAERYPDSGIVESYGDQWPGYCIDYWVYVDADRARVRLSTEGWNLPELAIELHGHPAMDGMNIASVFARILGVPDGR